MKVSRIPTGPALGFMRVGRARPPASITAAIALGGFLLAFGFWVPAGAAPDTWWLANDETRITRQGTWRWTSHRYAAESALATTEDGAALEFSAEGRTLVLGLDTLTPPNHFGPPELGALEVFVDGSRLRTILPRSEDREVVLLRTLLPERHRFRIVHRRDPNGGVGARIRGIRRVDESTGDLAVFISGEQNAALVDVRAVLSRQGKIVREALLRNWLTGRAALAAIAPAEDYTLELRATGWVTRRINGVAIQPGTETQLPPIYLEREGESSIDQFKFPGLGRPSMVVAGESFRSRFEGHKAVIQKVRLVRQAGRATISRAAEFTEDVAAAFYYHREGSITVPAGTPAGIYDLEITLADDRGSRRITSPRAVGVVRSMPRDPTFFSFGHLDTWGQYQAEYLTQLVTMANLVRPDMVLVSNEANPAYAAGALAGLDVPFVINFGNHRAPEPGPWFGEPVGIVDFGRSVAVLNFGRAWDTDVSEAATLLAARAGTPVKVINAFESNAPVADFLDRHRIALLHYAHGPGPAVAKLGATPTVRVGKVNSESFRVIRFKDGRPISYTYRGHATAPLPFARGGPPPLRVHYAPANDGTQRAITARVENDLEEDFPGAVLVFVLPRGTYQVDRGRIESAVDSDDLNYTEVMVRFDLPAKSAAAVMIHPTR